MKYSLLIACLLIFSAGIAQKTEKDHFVILHSGEKFSGTSLTYEMPILKPASFQLDDKQFETPQVGFFQNNHGYFANLNKIYGDKAERYAIRIKFGKVNLYEEISMDVYGKEELGVDKTNEEDMKKSDALATGETFQYYSVAEREIKKATVRNMKVDLADNPNAMHEIGMIRKYQILQGLLVGAGAGIIAYDIIRQSGGAVRFNPFMAVGIIVSGSSLFLEKPKENAKWLAVEAYNK